MDGDIAFLVVGAGRGGTSLLAGLLDAHPQLEVAFEYQSVPYLTGQAVDTEGPGLWDARVGAFLEACRREAARFPGVRWGNKITTEQILGLEDHNRANPDRPVDRLDRFFNADLAGIPIVFILRDGRTCVRSKMSRVGRSLAAAVDLWKESVAVWRFLCDRHHLSLCIRYEDLIQDPRVTLEGVCTFLGVPYDERMLDGTHSEKMLPEYRRTGMDAAPLSLAGTEDIERLIAAELVECGYATR